MLAATLILAQIAVTASAPAVVAACDAIEVRVRVSATGHVAPQVVAPPLTPFQLVRRSTQPTVSFSASGDPAITVEHLYVLATDRPGRYMLAPFRAELGGTTAHSLPLEIDVRASPGSTVPRVVAEARVDTSRDVNFRALALPDTVYVGQQVQYEVAVFLKESVRDRLRRNPTFFPPDMPGVLAYDLPTRRGEAPRRQVAGRCFDALVYQRALFPLQAGRIVIPPAQLVYAVPLGPGLFSRDQVHEMRTDSVVIVALAPPAEGRPPNDVGAVGTLEVGARVDTMHGRVGDPLTLTVRVSGEANVKLLPRPHLTLPWASLVPDGERVEIDSAARRIRGSKEFDWLVTPRRGGQLEIPAVEYPHFDPVARGYVVTRSEPLQLEIEAAPLARVDTAVVARALPIRASYRGPLGRPLHAHPGVWLLAAAAPIPALVGVVRHRRRRPRHGPGAAAVLAMLPACAALDARAVRRAFVAALAERLRIPSPVFTRSGALERALRRSGVTRELAAEAEAYLRDLDAAAYGTLVHDRFDAHAAARTAGRIYAEIDAEALARWELGPLASLLLTVGLTGAVAASAIASPASDAVEFSAAVSAYGNGDHAGAAEAFERLALREPRAPDAWANYGTASWATADTAGAVVGWQRALRLEPHARDVRARLDGVHLEAAGAPGHVPAVGVTPLAMVALGAWLIACAAGAGRPLGRRRRAVVATIGALAAIGLAGAAVLTDERLAAEDLVVLRSGGGLSVAPAIGAPRDLRAETGEVGRASAREGGWTYVRFDGGRAGWVPGGELASLARAPHRGD